MGTPDPLCAPPYFSSVCYFLSQSCGSALTPFRPGPNFHSRGDRVNLGSSAATRRPQAAQCPPSRRLYYAHLLSNANQRSQCHFPCLSLRISDPRARPSPSPPTSRIPVPTTDL